MSNNDKGLLDRLEASSIRLKASEEIERLKFQLTQERAVHAQTRDKLREARDALKAECFEHIETERRKEKEAAQLRVMYNEAVIRWDSAGSCAGAATGVLIGLSAAAMVCAALDAGGVLGASGFVLAATVGLMVGIFTNIRVYDTLVNDEGEE